MSKDRKLTAPDVTELLETIQELVGALSLATAYCAHPDVTSIPFASNSSVVAKRGDRAIRRAKDVIDRAAGAGS